MTTDLREVVTVDPDLQGYHVDTVENGQEALEKATADAHSAIPIPLLRILEMSCIILSRRGEMQVMDMIWPVKSPARSGWMSAGADRSGIPQKSFPRKKLHSTRKTL